METRIDEISDRIFRVSTFLPEMQFMFNQFLVDADEPLLFHTGPRGVFSAASEAVSAVMPLERLRWISFGHWEADESGTLNDWFALAPDAEVAQTETGVMVSVNDQSDRPARALADGEVLDLGGKQVRMLATPHVPHGWDAGVLFEETTETLLCGDLFSAGGASPVLTDEDLVPAAMEAEDFFQSTSLTPALAPTIRRLADLSPKTLALMHGPAFAGDCAGQLGALADAYEGRLEAARARERGMHPDEAIRTLIVSYAERLDAGDLDGVAALFEHATFRSTRRDEPLVGDAAVRGMYDSVTLYDDGTPRTKHVLGNITIDVDEASGTASSQCVFTVLQAVAGRDAGFVLAGRYLDRFERTDGKWRFTERIVAPDLMGDLSAHMGQP